MSNASDFDSANPFVPFAKTAPPTEPVEENPFAQFARDSRGIRKNNPFAIFVPGEGSGVLGGAGTISPFEGMEEAKAGLASANRAIIDYGVDPESRERRSELRRMDQDRRREAGLDRSSRDELREGENRYRKSQGLPPLPPEPTDDGFILRSLQDSRETAQARVAGELPVATQAPWRNFADNAFRSFLNVGPDSLKFLGLGAEALDFYYRAARYGIEEANRQDAAKNKAAFDEQPGAVPAGSNMLTRAADEASAALEEAFPADEARQSEMSTLFGGGTGSMASFLFGASIIGKLGKLAGLSQRTGRAIGVGGLGGAQQGTAGYEDASQYPSTSAQKYLSLIGNTLLGVTELLPIDHFFMRLNRATGGKVVNFITTTGAQGFEEFTQELGQGIGADVVAKEIAEYDKNREIGSDALPNAFVGLILGTIMGGGAAIFGRRPADKTGDETSDTAETEQPQNIPEGAVPADTLYPGPAEEPEGPGEAGVLDLGEITDRGVPAGRIAVPSQVPGEAGGTALPTAPEGAPPAAGAPAPVLPTAEAEIAQPAPAPAAAETVPGEVASEGADAEYRQELEDAGLSPVAVEKLVAARPKATTASPSEVVTPATDAAAEVRRKELEEAGVSGPALEKLAAIPSVPTASTETPTETEVSEAATPPKSEETTVGDNAGHRTAPVDLSAGGTIEDATARPKQEATDARIEAGNAELDHLKWRGYGIGIETRKGEERRSKPGQPPWVVPKMPIAYGKFKGIKGADGDDLDVNVGENTAVTSVFVLDQINPETGVFDEQKVFVQVPTEQAVRSIYARSFSDGRGKDRIGAVTKMTPEQFDAWAPTAHEGKPVGTITPKAAQTSGEKVTHPVEHPGLVIKSLETGKETVIQPKGTVPPAAKKPAPAEKPKSAASEWKLLGKNARGRPLFEDENGVRSYTENGVRVTEPVRITPGGSLILPTRREGAEWEPIAEKPAAPLTKEEPLAPIAPEVLAEPPTWAEILTAAPRAKGESRPDTEAVFRRMEEISGGTRRFVDLTSDQQRALLDAVKAEAEATAIKPLPSNYGAKNKLVSTARADELAARIKAKLRNQVSSGIDPEMIAMGAELTVYHIEAGARKFIDLVKAVAGHMGVEVAEIRPYLRSWYNGARDMMEDAGLETAGMDGPEEVRAAFQSLMGVTNAERTDVQPPPPEVPQGEPAGDVPGTPREGEPGRAPDAGGAVSDGNVRDNLDSDGDQQGTAEGVPGKGGRARGNTSRGGGNRSRGSREPAAPGPIEEAAEEAEESREQRLERNYIIKAGEPIGEGGPKFKVRANIEAIRLLKLIEAEKREATEDEKAVLVRYVGWGAFAQNVFADANPDWKVERQQLRELLTAEELRAARASTLNAHYTSRDVIAGMWSAIRHLGFTKGRALEPSAGVGHFIGLQPRAIAKRTDWSAVELDSITGRISKLLYAGADVNVMGFEEFQRPDNFYDLAVSNVPFGDFKIRDPKYPQGFSIHDYFFVKALDKVRPGGVVAFITSRYTMDKIADRARREVDKRAEFLGAIRLPGGKKGAFAGNAGTEVTTDIIFLRKRIPGVPSQGAEWGSVEQVQTPDGPVTINQYFATNPSAMLGQMRLTGSMYGSKEPVLVGNTENLEQQIAEAAKKFLPAGALVDLNARPIEKPVEITVDEKIKPGAFFEQDGKLLRRIEGVGQAASLSKVEEEKVRALMRMRDLVNKILARDPKADAWRGHLGKAYDAFVKKHGPIGLVNTTITTRMNKEGEPVIIRRLPNFKAFSVDPDAYKVLAIENYDEETGSSSKAAIFTEDMVGVPIEPTIAAPADAVAVSLDRYGRLIPEEIGKLLNMAPQAAMHELGDLVYRNPDGNAWETAAEYLSGDVLTKLENARTAALSSEQYDRNVKALEAVQPAPLTAVDIRAQMGAPWVPVDVYEQFFNDEVGVGRQPIRLSRDATRHAWTIRSGEFSRAAATRFATSRIGIEDVAKAAMNNEQVRIVDKYGDKTVFNQDATLEANLKIAEMRVAFTGDPELGIDAWWSRDPERTARIEVIYNRTFNRFVKRDVSGAHLSMPGLSTKMALSDGTVVPFALRPHQKDAIWRTVQDGNTLLDHVVGAGKTFTMIGSGMEQKRLGLIRRPMYVVPNHMLEQFSREFLQAYPNASILVADKESMSLARRKEFAGRVAAEMWDGIVITHDAFGRLAMSKRFNQDFLNEQIDEYREILEAAREAEGKGSQTVKNIERDVKAMEARLAQLMKEESKDEGATFEELGVDFLFVDEAHLFKNLAFATKMKRVKGLGGTASQRATGLFMKIRYLEGMRPGRAAVFATGTPISNTIAEMFTMQRYLQLARMKELGIDKFDAWANTFGEVVTKPELSADGRSFRDSTSFSRFVNIPELINIYSQVADTRTADMLKLPRPELSKRADGTRGIIIVEAEPTPAEEAYIVSLVQRAEEARGKKAEKGGDNILKIVTEGRKVATDFRLLYPDAPMNPAGKASLLMENVIRIWERTKIARSAQMIFLDMGTPKAKKPTKPRPEDAPAHGVTFIDEEGNVHGDIEDAEVFASKFDLYTAVRDSLVARGVPRAEIAFIHEAGDDTKKALLFERVRRGQVRVLIGSTGKMGMGTNVQKKLVAMHHWDAPWKPAEVEQRDGRILRQGNENAEVEIYRYVLKRSFDAFMWQTLERKAGFISQLKAGARGVRVAEDIDDPLPDAAELKAAASGDPRIQEHAELRKKVQVLEAQSRNHERTIREAKWKLDNDTKSLALTNESITRRTADAALVEDVTGKNFSMDLTPIGAGVVTKWADAGKVIIEWFAPQAERIYEERDRPRELKIGTLSGLGMRLMAYRQTAQVNGQHIAYVVMKPELQGEDRYYTSGSSAEFAPDMDAGGMVSRFTSILPVVQESLNYSIGRKAELEASNPVLLELTKDRPFLRKDELAAAIARLKELTKELSDAGKKKPEAAATALSALPRGGVNSAAFREWFGGSKVVDDAGAPKVMFHGTGETFDAFSIHKANPDSLYGPGFYFTDSPNVAGGTTRPDDTRPETFDFEEIEARAIFRQAGYAWQGQRWAVDSTALTPKKLDHLWRLLNSNQHLRDIREMDALGDMGRERGRIMNAVENAARARKAQAIGRRAPVTAITEKARIAHHTAYGMNVNEIVEDIAKWLASDAPTWVRERMGMERQPTTRPQVYPVYLSIEYPFDVSEDDNQARYDSMAVRFDGDKGRVQEQLRAEGYDGIRYPGGNIVSTMGQHDVWIAFKPEQVKSIANQGTFDAGNPSMLLNAAPRSRMLLSPAEAKETERAIRAEVKRIAGGDVSVWTFDTIPLTEFQAQAARDYGDLASGETIGGVATVQSSGEALVRVALQDPVYANPWQTAWEEAYHIVEMRSMDEKTFADVNAPENMEIAVEMAARDTGLHPDLVRQLPTYEIRAKAFVQYLATREAGLDPQPASSALLQWFKKLLDMIEAVRGNLARRGIRTIDQIFEDVFQGRFAEAGPRIRAPGQGLSAVPRDSAFKKWFGKSKVVDEDGSPMVVYHGTARDFDVFDPQEGETIGSGMLQEVGIKANFFTSSLEVAQGFAEGQDVGEAEGERVISAYLSIQNPYVIHANGRGWPRFMEETIAALKEGIHDGVIIHRVEDGFFEGAISDVYIVPRSNQIKSTENRGTFDPNEPSILLSAIPRGGDPFSPGQNEGRQREVGRRLDLGQPIDRVIRIPFQIFGGVDEIGRWKPGLRLWQKRQSLMTGAALGAGIGTTVGGPVGTVVGGAAGALVGAAFTYRGRFTWFNHIMENARRGLLDNYGLDPDYVARGREAKLEERARLLQIPEMLAIFKDRGIGAAEARVLQAILTGEEGVREEWADLSEPIREAIDMMAQEAVELGQIPAESYERWRGIHLHRSYMKHEDPGTFSGMIASMKKSHRKRIIGNQLKGRGLWMTAKLAKMFPGVEEPTRPANGEKYRVLDRLSEDDGTLGAADAKVLERRYLPDTETIPDDMADWEDRGVWEVRGWERGRVVLWRDFTKPERLQMGEILDVRYNIAKTWMGMAHDLSVGKFYRDIAQNESWATNDLPEGANWKDGGEYGVFAGRVWDDVTIEWVKVPDTIIAKSNAKRYGALAGMYVRAEIWRDIHEMELMNKASFWRTILTGWKISKTALSPVVHMNNVMSNVMFMDLADVRARDLIRGIQSVTRKDAAYEEALANGAFGADLISNEIRQNILKPLLAELEREHASGVGVSGNVKLLGRAGELIFRFGKKWAIDKPIALYQLEDEWFRMALYHRRRSQGMSPLQAADEARETFIDYDIKAPWVNMARRSVLPFVAYTYRAIPQIAKSIATRPWKLAKYFLLANAANMFSYAVFPGDEDEERRATPEELEGFTWIGAPRMLRLPFGDGYGNPMFLDIRRWIPSGDVFDLNQGHSALPLLAWLQPGGPIAIAAELFLNRQAFTGEPIVNELTDDWWDRTQKLADFGWKSAIPSAAWVPGSWYWQKIGRALTGARESGLSGGEPYSVAQAALQSVGIKVKALDVQAEFRIKAFRFDQVEQELGFQMRDLARQRQRRLITQSEYNKARYKIIDKAKTLNDKRRATFHGEGGR